MRVRSIYLTLLLVLFGGGIYRVGNAFAISLVSFADYDFSSVEFDNRVRLSTDITNVEFETNQSVDLNGDGLVDRLEENTFGITGETATFYVGNKHNGFDLGGVLLYAGISGTFDSVTINQLTIQSGQETPVSDASVFLADTLVVGSLDGILLFFINEKIEDRNPNGSPIGTNHPVEITVSGVQSKDPSLRFYFGAYGMLLSGTLNSYTPSYSDVLFQPAFIVTPTGGEVPESIEAVTTVVPSTEPVPEPSTLACCLLGGLAAFARRKKEAIR